VTGEAPPGTGTAMTTEEDFQNALDTKPDDFHTWVISFT
jgi:hypothetical protein